jgi:dTDP-4-dehydrorhamnose 3,5-epimerase
MPVKVVETTLPGVILVEPRVFGDSRGYFFESYHAKRYEEAGISTHFVQDNLSRSVKGTLRGLHFQEPHGQGKLVYCVRGAVFDVAVDIRRGSPNFGKWFGAELSEENHRQMWVPPGFAHGFCVLSDSADFFYKCTDLYHAECDRGVAWNDPDIDVKWPIETPLLSEKDRKLPRLKDTTELPSYR